jgi:hypothetical protein
MEGRNQASSLLVMPSIEGPCKEYVEFDFNLPIDKIIQECPYQSQNYLKIKGPCSQNMEDFSMGWKRLS